MRPQGADLRPLHSCRKGNEALWKPALWTMFYLCVHRWRYATLCRIEPHNGFCKFKSGHSSMLLKRACDIIGAVIAVIIFAVPMAMVALAVRTTSQGPALYCSQRMGRGNRLFLMPKFRPHAYRHTGRCHSSSWRRRTASGPCGNFLRKTSVDELPQLRCILNGDMSSVRPRPALFNQDELPAAPKPESAHRLLPEEVGSGKRTRRVGDPR